MLADILRNNMQDALFISEFSTNTVGKYLQESVVEKPYLVLDSYIANSLLFLSDFFETVDTRIIPALDKGQNVISDRGFLSKITLQAAVMEEKYSAEVTESILIPLFKVIPRPDMTVFLDIAPDIVISRLKKRDGICTEEREHYVNKTKQLSPIFIEKFSLNHITLKSEKEVDDYVKNFRNNSQFAD